METVVSHRQPSDTSDLIEVNAMNFKVSLMSLASTLLLATPVTLVAAGPSQAAEWPCGANNSLTCRSLPCDRVGDTEYSDHCVSAIGGPGTAGPVQQATPLDARARGKGTAIPAGPSASTAKPKPITGTPTTSPAKPIP